MKIGIIAQYYAPETVGSGIWIRELAEELVARGHDVTVLTAFPNYPERIVFEGYRGKLFSHESINGVNIIRSWIYANPKESLWSRLLNWGSFCWSSFFSGLFAGGKLDVLYAIIPPLPLGITASWLGKLRGYPVVTNLQDIYPLIAIELGLLRNKRLISIFESMERKVYRRSRKIVLISEGFKENLVDKGVDPEKIAVVPNWADPNFIQPGPKENQFRKELGVNSDFTVVYSGGLTHNSDVEPILRAAGMMSDKPISFVVVGDGVMKPELEKLAAQLNLSNLQFRPFQPLENYPDVLRAADISVVTLNNAARCASLPSKVFKQMAAGRPILAITTPGGELDRLVREAECGVSVPTGSPEEVVKALSWCLENRDELEQMGRNSRDYLVKHHSKNGCIDQIEQVLAEAVAK